MKRRPTSAAQILLDMSGSMSYGEPPAITKLQYASYLTAVLAYLMMRQQDAVGLTAFDTEIRLDMPARSSPRHFDEMMNQLETIKPGRTTNLGATLNRLADRFKRRCLIILISDLYDEPEAVDRALHHFHHKRHEVIVFHVLDHAEIDFPFRERPASSTWRPANESRSTRPTSATTTAARSRRSSTAIAASARIASLIMC